LKILNRIVSPLSKATITKYLLSTFLTVLWHPVCGLCGRQAAVFFQYLVGHSDPI